MNAPPNDYLPDPCLKGREYLHTDGISRIWAIEMDTTFAVHPGPLQGRSGDYLCKGPSGTMWPMVRQVFLAQWRPWDPKVVLPPQVAKSENDPGGLT